MRALARSGREVEHFRRKVPFFVPALAIEERRSHGHSDDHAPHESGILVSAYGAANVASCEPSDKTSKKIARDGASKHVGFDSRHFDFGDLEPVSALDELLEVGN